MAAQNNEFSLFPSLSTFWSESSFVSRFSFDRESLTQQERSLHYINQETSQGLALNTRKFLQDPNSTLEQTQSSEFLTENSAWMFYLFHIVASLCTGLNEHDIQLFGSLFPFLCGDLPAQRWKRDTRNRRKSYRWLAVSCCSPPRGYSPPQDPGGFTSFFFLASPTSHLPAGSENTSGKLPREPLELWQMSSTG